MDRLRHTSSVRLLISGDRNCCMIYPWLACSCTAHQLLYLQQTSKGQIYDNSICSGLGYYLCRPCISHLQILDLSLCQWGRLAISLVQAGLQLLSGRRLWVWIQELGHLATRKLQLRKENRAFGFRRLHCGTERLNRVPGVVDIENGIVIVLQVVAVDRNVAGANKTCASFGKFCPC